MVALHQIMTHPEIDVSTPILDYQPGNPVPDFDALAWQAQSRWTRPVEETLVATATKKAKQLAGGSIGGRPIRTREATHDIHCAAIYLGLRERHPELAECWLPEDALSHLEGRKIPDAIIRCDPPIVIEFVGSYSAKKLRGIHAELGVQRYQFY